MTPLDEALAAARQEPDKGHLFYDAFLNADLLLPVKTDSEESPGFKELGESDKFHPLFLKYEDKKVLPVFDTLEKMRAWAQDAPLDYVTVKGHKLTHMVDGSVEMAVNLGTPHAYHFTKELLETLRTHMQLVHPSQKN